MKNKSLLMTNIAVLLFGMAGILAKSVSVPSIGITFGRVFFSSITLFIYMKLTGRSFAVDNRRHLYTMLAAGVVLAFHWWSFLQSVRVSTVAIGTITFSSFPLFVTFLEPLVYHTRLTAKNVLCALAMVAGVCITIPQFSPENNMTAGIAIGMASALSYAVLTLLNKNLSASYPGTKISFYEQGTAAVVLLPIVLFMHLQPTATDIAVILVLGIVTTALAHTLYITSLRGIPAHLAGIISSMETVYGIALAWLVLGEVPSLREVLGGAVILAVVLYSQLSQDK